MGLRRRSAARELPYTTVAAKVYTNEYATQYSLIDEPPQLSASYDDRVEVMARKLKQADDPYHAILSPSNIADISLQKEPLLRTIGDLERRFSPAIESTAGLQADQ